MENKDVIILVLILVIAYLVLVKKEGYMRLTPEKWGDDSYWVNKNRLVLPDQSDPYYATSVYAMPKDMEGPTLGPQYDGLPDGYTVGATKVSASPASSPALDVTLSNNPLELNINKENTVIYSHATDDLKQLESGGLSEPANKADIPLAEDETLGSEIKNPLPNSIAGTMQAELQEGLNDTITEVPQAVPLDKVNEQVLGVQTATMEGVM